MDGNRKKSFYSKPPPWRREGEIWEYPGPQLCPTNLLLYGRATPTPNKPKPTGGVSALYIYILFYDSFNTKLGLNLFSGTITIGKEGKECPLCRPPAGGRVGGGGGFLVYGAKKCLPSQSGAGCRERERERFKVERYLLYLLCLSPLLTAKSHPSIFLPLI